MWNRFNLQYDMVNVDSLLRKSSWEEVAQINDNIVGLEIGDYWRFQFNCLRKVGRVLEEFDIIVVSTSRRKLNHFPVNQDRFNFFLISNLIFCRGENSDHSLLLISLYRENMLAVQLLPYRLDRESAAIKLIKNFTLTSGLKRLYHPNDCTITLWFFKMKKVFIVMLLIFLFNLYLSEPLNQDEDYQK